MLSSLSAATAASAPLVWASRISPYAAIETTPPPRPANACFRASPGSRLPRRAIATTGRTQDWRRNSQPAYARTGAPPETAYPSTTV